jgi:hypothetical protein
MKALGHGSAHRATRDARRSRGRVDFRVIDEWIARGAPVSAVR